MLNMFISSEPMSSKERNFTSLILEILVALRLIGDAIVLVLCCRGRYRRFVALRRL